MLEYDLNKSYSNIFVFLPHAMEEGAQAIMLLLTAIPSVGTI